MARTVYYSVHGGAVVAVLNAADPASDLQVIQGSLRKTTIPDTHELSKHIDNESQATSLDGWIVTGERLQKRER